MSGRFITMGGKQSHPPHPTVEDTMDTSMEPYVPPPPTPFHTQSAIAVEGWQEESALQTLLPHSPIPATIVSPDSDLEQVIRSTTTQFPPPGSKAK